MEDIQRKLDRLPPEGKSRTKAVLYSELGTLLYKDGRMAEAIRAFETALQNKTTRSVRRHIYVFLGKSYESSGRLDKAIAAYEQATQLDPNDWRRHRDLGGLYEAVKLYPAAAASYRAALALGPKEPSLHMALGQLLRKMGFYGEAEKHVTQALQWGHDAAAVNAELSFILENRGRFADAARAWERVLAVNSPLKDWGRLIYLAYLADDAGLMDRGLAVLRERKAEEETLQFYQALSAEMKGQTKSVLTREASAVLRPLIESVVTP